MDSETVFVRTAGLLAGLAWMARRYLLAGLLVVGAGSAYGTTGAITATVMVTALFLGRRL